MSIFLWLQIKHNILWLRCTVQQSNSLRSSKQEKVIAKGIHSKAQQAYAERHSHSYIHLWFSILYTKSSEPMNCKQLYDDASHACARHLIVRKYKCLCLLFLGFILFSDVVLVRSNILRGVHSPQISSRSEGFFALSFAFALPQKKVPQATDRNSKHPYIGWAISWPLYRYPQCLRLFTILLALNPTLPPSILLCSYWVSEL